MDSNDFVSINSVLSDVLMLVDDEHLRKGMSKGYYISGIEQAIQEIALDTYFMVITKDLTMDKVKFQVPMPKNAFNIREMYLWNGSCCSPSSTVIVHWKRLYNNHNGGAGYTAKRMDDRSPNKDPFYHPFYFDKALVDGANLYYANVQNGIIMFSSNCSGFDNVRLVYNGMGVDDIGDEPIIPRMLRQFVIDYSVERAYRTLMAKDSRTYGGLWKVAENKLNDLRTGSLYIARKRVSSMNTWSRDSANEYYSKKW